jgi:hypothetical protein
MSFIKYILFLGIFIQIDLTVESQILKTPKYSIETGTSLSGGRETPFWLFSNQYGLVTPNKYNVWGRSRVYSLLSDTLNFDYDYCIDLVNRYSEKNDLYIHQAYLRLKLYFVTIQAGSKEEQFGNQDSSLSSGGLLWSGNARPMNKVSVIVPNYTKIPFTFGFFEFKGGMSHGWFDDNEYVKNTWLHHKFGYIQFGGKLPFHLHFGLHHYAQWGGEMANGRILPQSKTDFVKVFFAKSGGTGSPIGDSLNVLGNHIGSRNFGLDVNLPKAKMGLYWQTIFEDGSGEAYRNIKDGLFGFYFHFNDKNKLVNGFVYEFINTTDQSGTYNDFWTLNGIDYRFAIPGGVHHEAGGNDNYFNNGVYLYGWNYRRMSVGNPLITSLSVLKGEQADVVRNNKITGHHIGIEGVGLSVRYKLFYTYYRNYGTNTYPINPYIPQQSILLQTSISNRLPWNLDLRMKVGIDIGKMYGNNLGFQFLLIKTGAF